MSSSPLPGLSPRDLARIAGLLYLLIAVAGGLAGIVRSRSFDPDAAARTAANVLANGVLLVPGFAAWLSAAILTPAVIVEIALIAWLQARWPAVTSAGAPMPRIAPALP